MHTPTERIYPVSMTVWIIVSILKLSRFVLIAVVKDFNSSATPAQRYFSLEVAIDHSGRISVLTALLNKTIANQ